MKRIAFRLAAGALLAGLLVRCDTSDCGGCRNDYDECLGSCLEFEDCERCEDAYDSCLEGCGTSNVETSCEDYDPGEY